MDKYGKLIGVRTFPKRVSATFSFRDNWGRYFEASILAENITQAHTLAHAMGWALDIMSREHDVNFMLEDPEHVVFKGGD